MPSFRLSDLPDDKILSLDEISKKCKSYMYNIYIDKDENDMIYTYDLDMVRLPLTFKDTDIKIPKLDSMDTLNFIILNDAEYRLISPTYSKNHTKWLVEHLGGYTYIASLIDNMYYKTLFEQLHRAKYESRDLNFMYDSHIIHSDAKKNFLRRINIWLKLIYIRVYGITDEFSKRFKLNYADLSERIYKLDNSSELVYREYSYLIRVMIFFKYILNL
jgi:hypothetical protein